MLLLLCLAFSPLCAEEKPAAPAPAPVAAAAAIKNVDAKAAISLVKADKAITVIDVRTPAEYATNHVEGALNIDFKSADFAKEVAALDKTKPYLIHCAHGTRSSKAKETFEKLKFSKVYHLDGGISAWTEAGGKVVQGGN